MRPCVSFVPFWLLLSLPGQDPIRELPPWTGPGKGQIELRLLPSGERAAPCVLVAGGGPVALLLGNELKERGITSLFLLQPTSERLAAAHGLIQMHAGELSIDASRMAFAAAGDGIAPMFEWTTEERPRGLGLLLLDGFAPVIEGLRSDLPICLIATNDTSERTRRGQQELAHQAVVAGASARVITTPEAERIGAEFLMLRLRLVKVADFSTVSEGFAEQAYASADRGDVTDVLTWCDHVVTGRPDLAATLASDPGLARIRREPAFLTWQRERGPVGKLWLAHPTEPGIPMHVRCRLVDANNQPLVGVALDLWQTDALGRYNHRQDNDDARLRGSVRTDTRGEIELTSIRPLGYAGTMIPAHVHVRIHHGNRPREVELLFGDDPRLTDELAQRLVARGFAVATLDAQGRGDATFRLPAPR